MDRFLFTEILDRTFVPFIEKEFPDSHRFMQDNDPKHTSIYARDFIIENGINWWKTPAESPDLNPIENLWHELKEFSRREVKPRTKQELIDGILKFWEIVSIEKCNRYINHLDKVINPRRMREGYGSRSVCVSVCVSVTAPAATYLFYTSKTRCH